MELESRLRAYVEKLKGQTGFFVRDNEIVNYFTTNPNNSSREEVSLKVNMISDRDLNRELAGEEMIEHIINLHPDERIQKGDLTVVEDIAHLDVRGTPKHFLRFASLYCNYHKPDIFPIYSTEHHDLYRQYIANNKLDVNPDQLDQYLVFKKLLDHVMTRFHLDEQLNYQEARKLGWLYLDKVINGD